jgi:hypothetical protein
MRFVVQTPGRRSFQAAGIDPGHRPNRRPGRRGCTCVRSCRAAPKPARVHGHEHQLAVVRAHLNEAGIRPSKLMEFYSGLRVALPLVLDLSCASPAFGASFSQAGFNAVKLAGILASGPPADHGMGIAEAGLALGKTASGTEKQVATAAVFVQRLIFAYPRSPAGWLTLWIRKREYP